ncbi:IclR family transcriptional regulator [Brachybacterium sp. AOP43-C2-M15]|uniref:IclR family transcriptional regulator n=1 Tax=Brachybacterium sp. AOP43-C2-M15 TaxID=3457661 RepID=UPI004033F846
MAEGRPMRVLANSATVIDALAERGDLTPAEIAEMTGLPRPSVYRFLDGLRTIGLATSTTEGRTRLSAKWLHLSDAARAAMTEWDGARTVLDELAEETGQTVFLSVPRGDVALCVDWAPGRGIGVVVLAPGRSLPLYAGAAGRLLLAGSGRLEDYLSAGPPRRPLTPYTLVEAQALRADVARTLENGSTLSLDDATVGVGAVAVPVRDGAGRPLGALSVAGRSADFRTRAEEFTAAAARAAGRLPVGS